jgi:ketosteroid isomerase-like protein
MSGHPFTTICIQLAILAQAEIVHSSMKIRRLIEKSKSSSKLVVALLAGSSILMSGCGTLGSKKSSEITQVKARLGEIIDAAVAKDFKRLDSYHLYGPKFSKFSTNPAERLDAEAARAGEHNGLSGANDLTMQIQDLKIDLFDNAAVATFILNYGFTVGNGRVEKDARSTLVLVKEGGEWKIVHEHLSAPPTPP